MSTHSLDVSGARPLTTTTNDPARTAVTMNAKAGDDVIATLSGFRELRVSLADGSAARVQRRRFILKTVRKDEHGKPIKDPADDLLYLYDETPYEELILVMTSGTFFGRTSNLPDAVAAAGADNKAAPYEGTPHTHVAVRRSDGPHFLESGELLEELTVKEWIEGKLVVADSPE